MNGATHKQRRETGPRKCRRGSDESLGTRWVLIMGVWLAIVPALAQVSVPLDFDAPATIQVVYEAPSDFNRRVFVVEKDGLRSMRFGDLYGEDQS
ncbi:MAG: hypothetical protein AAGL66_08985, partial [Pseudomonadota bacterium]